MSSLSTHGISKRYGARRVVNGVSLTLRTGEVAGLLGPNGAGKTTCFYMIVGLVPCGDGRIMLDDTDITGQPMHVRARHGLGYLPQEASVFRKLSVADNLMAILETRAGLSADERERRPQPQSRVNAASRYRRACSRTRRPGCTRSPGVVQHTARPDRRWQ